MSKVIIGIDGFDGSGKTTLCNSILKFAREKNVKTRLVGRDSNTGDYSIAQFTNIIKKSDSKDPAILSKYANFYLRLARAAQRFDICSTSPHELLILDRFLINDLSMLNVEIRTEYCKSFSELCIPFEILSVEIKGEFSLLWDRVQQRSELSPKELVGESFNRTLYNGYTDTKMEGELPFRSLRLAQEKKPTRRWPRFGSPCPCSNSDSVLLLRSISRRSVVVLLSLDSVIATVSRNSEYYDK